MDNIIPVKVELKHNFNLYVKYNDGLEGEISLLKVIDKGEFLSLTEDVIKNEYYIDDKSGDICWPGNVSLCKDAIYRQLELKRMLKGFKIDESLM